MHDAVRGWVRRHVPSTASRVVEFGSLDINGGVRDLLPAAATYIGVDVQDGPGVDIVADAATWAPDDPPDLVLCLEVFEHCETWRDLIVNAYNILAPGGLFICTAAAPGRAPHSARRESSPDADEWYRNIADVDLHDALSAAGFETVTVDIAGVDVRGAATKSV